MEPQKSANLLDLMTPEHKEKAARREQERAALITKEWAGLAELGYYYGWEAIRDVFNDVITLEQVRMFVEGARKVHSSHVYDQAVATLAGNSTKKGRFENLMKYYIKDMRTAQ